MRVGIEIGGTFTDLICVEGGRVSVTKVPSTPASPEIGFANALRAANLKPVQVQDLVHGSTVATNAVLERKGARILLVTTKGFRDVLWIQRQDRARSFELVYRKPEPVVQRRHVVEVDERIAADGTLVVALDEASACQDITRAIAAHEPEVVAIALLNSYVNPHHERRLRDLIHQRLPAVGVMCSHEICPEFREYERFSTTALSAYVQPVITSYLGGIQQDLHEQGFTGHISLMQSNGGRMPASAMQGNPVTALYSGPAAGVAGANLVARRAGRQDLITFDMGGTSADVCLISGNRLSLKAGTRIDGLPVRSPVLDISTVGAGGGSLIWRDEGGMLRVGPTSSGAMPGPACYGRGGTLPTVTDAHAVCGTLRPELFLGGKASLDVDAARKAFQPLAEHFDCTVEVIADNAIRVANAEIVRAIQAVSTEVGKDPRLYSLMAFGGAGPLHAGRIAELLGVREVLLPRHAGVLSALGLLASPYTVYETATRKIPIDSEAPLLVRSVLASLDALARNKLSKAGVRGHFTPEISLLMRYVGQAFELEVSLEEDAVHGLNATQLRQRYETAAAGQMNFRPTGARAVEIVGFRYGLTALAADELNLRMDIDVEAGAGGECVILEDRHPRRCAIAPWPTGSHTAIAGPTIVDAKTSTMYIPPNWTARLNVESACLVMQHDGESK